MSEPPSFVKKIENIAIVLGKIAEFHCVVAGSPPLTVQWQKDEDWIIEDANIERTFEGNVASLKIAVSEASYSGRYTCQVSNEAGQEKSFATLVVQGLCFYLL